MTTRIAVVDAAMTTVGQSYTDAIQWVIGILTSTGAIPTGDYTHYTAALLIADLHELGASFRRGTWPEPGDLFVFHAPEEPRRLGVLGNMPDVICPPFGGSTIVCVPPSGIPGRHGKVWTMPWLT